jgi:pSer/pThr/pTyr-binding forkhead associated (FHA) protein
MPARLVALDEGPDIPLDRAMVVVGRHPQCDARLDSLRVSRHHCCMSQDHGEVIVRDLGSTNGIRINGQRVEFGRLRPGDELSIAHIRFRLDNGQGHEATLADGLVVREPKQDPAAAAGLAFAQSPAHSGLPFGQAEPLAMAKGGSGEQRLVAAVREALDRKAVPTNLADRCRIQVIVQVPGEGASDAGEAGPQDALEDVDACPPDSSH